MKKNLTALFSLLLFFNTHADLNQQLAELEITLGLLSSQLPSAPKEFTISSLRQLLQKKVDDQDLEARPFEPRETFLIPPAMLETLGDQCAQTVQNLHEKTTWVHNAKPDKQAYDLNKDTFIAYTQKLVIPTGSEVAFWGDTHGSASSLSRELVWLKDNGYLNDDFKIIKDNFYMVFLGDCEDRGFYGVEIWYMLYRLKIANPEKVIIARGNHEDEQINRQFGFYTEFNSKYPFWTDLWEKITNFYRLLPVALYLGCENNFIMCCHGGFEIGYLPNELLKENNARALELITELKRKTNFDTLMKKYKDGIFEPGTINYTYAKKYGSIAGKDYPGFPVIKDFKPITFNDPDSFGFAWNDFISDPKKFKTPEAEAQIEALGIAPEGVNTFKQEYFVFNERRATGLALGKIMTKGLLDLSSANGALLNSIFRGHQHNSTMDPELWITSGLYNLWNGMVFTFLSAPASKLQSQKLNMNFDFDNFVILTTAPKFDDWTLTQVWRYILKPNDFTKEPAKSLKEVDLVETATEEEEPSE